MTKTRVIRSAAASVVAILLVTGIALAAEGRARLTPHGSPGMSPASLPARAGSMPELAGDTPEPRETPEPTRSPEPHRVTSASTPEPTDTPEPRETPESRETPEPSETPEASESPEPSETPDREDRSAVTGAVRPSAATASHSDDDQDRSGDHHSDEHD